MARGARRLRALQRRRRPDAAAAGGRRGRASSASPRTGPARRIGEMIAAFEQGRRRARPREVNARLLESFAFETSDVAPNPIPAKAMMRVLGLAGRPVPAADGPGARGHRRPGPAGARRPAQGADEPAARSPWLSPSASPSSAASARSAATAPCSRVDGRILLLDCGLMFPDADMLGIDLVLPDFTWLRENARPHRGLHRHPRPRGPRRRPLVPAARPVVPDLRLGRSRSGWPATASRRRACSTAPSSSPVVDGERRAHRARSTVEFIPVTHSVPHGFATAFHTPQGVILHSGDFKLDLTPVDGRLTDLARIGAHRATSTASACCCPTPPTPRSPVTRRPSASVGQVLRDLFRDHEGRRIITACFASHIHRIQQIADAAHRAPGASSPRSGCSMAKNVRAGPRDGPAPHPRRPHSSTSRRSATFDPGEGVRHLDRVAGRAHVGAGAAWPPGENKWLKIGEDDIVILSSHAIPGNEYNVNKVIDGLLPARRRGRALRRGRRARHRPRQGRGAQDAAVDRASPSSSSPCTASSAT